jgi:hypothetical protein
MSFHCHASLPLGPDNQAILSPTAKAGSVCLNGFLRSTLTAPEAATAQVKPESAALLMGNYWQRLAKESGEERMIITHLPRVSYVEERSLKGYHMNVRYI